MGAEGLSELLRTNISGVPDADEIRPQLEADLAAVIRTVVRPDKSGIHPATRSFQALRIAVNDELGDIEAALAQSAAMLVPGGRLVVVSFHSLEDRIVKDAFREAAKQGSMSLLTKKPLTATEEESDRNPRARSAKLRAAERI